MPQWLDHSSLDDVDYLRYICMSEPYLSQGLVCFHLLLNRKDLLLPIIGRDRDLERAVYIKLMAFLFPLLVESRTSGLS